MGKWHVVIPVDKIVDFSNWINRMGGRRRFSQIFRRRYYFKADFQGEPWEAGHLKSYGATKIRPILPQGRLVSAGKPELVCWARFSRYTVDEVVAALQERRIKTCRTKRSPAGHIYKLTGPGLHGQLIGQVPGLDLIRGPIPVSEANNKKGRLFSAGAWL